MPDTPPTTRKRALATLTLKAQLAEVRRELAALKAEEDRILALLKGSTKRDIEIEAGVGVAGLAIGLGLEAL